MSHSPTAAAASPLRGAYIATVFLLALTGFAQMPIFKRYYIADIPGFGWLAKYYVTHYLHYIGAIALLALLAYVAVSYLMRWSGEYRITASGYVRVALLAGILATGIPRVIKNFEGVYMSSGWIIFLDLLHVAVVVGFLLVNLYCLARRRPWVRGRALSATA